MRRLRDRLAGSALLRERRVTTNRCCTAELLADPGFRRRARTLEFELHSRPVMSGDEITLLLED
jgi:hypothetical protein